MKDDVVTPTGGYGNPVRLATLTPSSAALDSDTFQGALHRYTLLPHTDMPAWSKRP